jgi:hypothetical protein
MTANAPVSPLARPLLGFVALLAALGIASPASAQAQITKRYGLTSFDRIEVQGDMIVEITPSSSISAVAEGTSDALDSLQLEVRERTLYIQQGFEGSYGPRRSTSGPVHIRLTAQNLSVARMIGSGSIRVQGLRGPLVQLVLDGAGGIDATVPTGTEVSARAVGSGTITLTGRAQTFTALTNGAATINAAALPVRDLTVQSVGSGGGSFAASGTAHVSATGSASISVSGQPQCTVRNAGAGTISCGDNARNRLPQRGDVD